jgi:hypothetical protein
VTYPRLFAAILLALALAPACASKNAPKPRTVAPTITRDIPSSLRGTVMAEATLLKADPVIVSGYGLVVGLNGTGGGDLDERIAASMERELGLMQVGHESDVFQGTPLEGKSPREVLRSREVAVVVVFGAVIPGAPRGATFDVYVRAASNSPDISLEGGTLWTTELQIGPATPVGGIKTRKIARAHGPVFINPFAEPGAPNGFSRRDGRILGGGVVTAPLDLELVLDNESHSRAKAMTDAINNRFRPGPGEEVVARGRSSRLITITVPAAYRERSAEFLEVLRHIQIDQSQPQEYARRYVEALKTQPYLGNDLSWCLQALPQKAALPFLREMYDYQDLVPRLAALRAGAGLGDPMTAPHLKQLAADPGAATPVRADAIHLLGNLSAGPSVDLALAEQLNAKELMVRVAAYEALADREEKIQLRRWLEHRATLPAAVRVSLPDAGPDSRILLELPGNSIQGVRRKVVAGKFLLDIVPAGDPLIFVSQQGRPRIVLFGDKLEIQRPVLVTAWDGGGAGAQDGSPSQTHLPRLMLLAESATDTPELYYRYPDRTEEDGSTRPGLTVKNKVQPDLVSFIEYLAHNPSPEDPKPGLGLTYSEVVGALNAIQQQGGFGKTPLAIEENLLRARLLQAANAAVTEERPETLQDVSEVKVYEPVKDQAKPAQPAPESRPSLVVPLEQPKPRK